MQSLRVPTAASEPTRIDQAIRPSPSRTTSPIPIATWSNSASELCREKLKCCGANLPNCTEVGEIFGRGRQTAPAVGAMIGFKDVSQSGVVAN